MSDLTLALRLFVGGGRAQLLRLGLLAGGLALSLVAVLLVLQIPAILADRAAVSAARTPVLANDATAAGGFRVFEARGTWAGVSLRRVFLSGVSQGASTPPGVDRLPQPGEVVVSPAVGDLLGGDPRFAPMVPGQVVDQISNQGLQDPRELVAYIGVANGGGASQAVGWGFPTGAGFDESSDQFAFVGRELSVLLLPATVIYVLACGRLAARTRQRRYAALRLIGASKRTLVRVASLEVGVAVALGVIIGVMAYRMVAPRLGRSGVVGLSWFPEQATIDALTWFGLAFTAGLGVWLAGRAAASRVVENPIASRRVAPGTEPRWWWSLPIALGAGLLLPLLPVGEHGHPSQRVGWIALGGATLLCVGALPAAALVVRGMVLLAQRLPAPMSLMIATGRLRLDVVGAVKLMSGLAVLLLTASTASGILVAAQASASSETRPVTVHAYANEVDRADRAEFGAMAAYGRFTTVVSSRVKASLNATGGEDLRTILDERGIRVLVAPCDVAGKVLELDGRCADERMYRVVGPGAEVELPVGVPIDFRTADGMRELVAPKASLRAAGGPNHSASLLYTGRLMPDAWYQDATFYWLLEPGIDTLDRFSSALAERAPRATANSSLDTAALQAYRVHRSTIRFGVLAGFVLGVFALLITLVDRSVERRREIVGLTVLGVTSQTIRLAQFWFAFAPMVVISVLALAVGFVVSNAISAIDANHPRWYTEPVSDALPLVAIGVVACLVSGLFIYGIRPRAEDLRRE